MLKIKILKFLAFHLVSLISDLVQIADFVIR